MIYEYECLDCRTYFTRIKSHQEYLDPEHCACGQPAKKLLSLPQIKKPERSEATFNPGLGQVVKSKYHRGELCKRMGVEEIGNEPVKAIHREADKTMEAKLSWDNICT